MKRNPIYKAYHWRWCPARSSAQPRRKSLMRAMYLKRFFLRRKNTISSLKVQTKTGPCAEEGMKPARTISPKKSLILKEMVRPPKKRGRAFPFEDEHRQFFEGPALRRCSERHLLAQADRNALGSEARNITAKAYQGNACIPRTRNRHILISIQESLY